MWLKHVPFNVILGLLLASRTSINLMMLRLLLQYTIAMMGYGPEDKNAVMELTYNYGITDYEKGNAYAQVQYFSNLHHVIFVLQSTGKFILVQKHE